MRRYDADLDRGDVERFDCVTRGHRWTKEARRILRSAPSCIDDPDEPTEILVARAETTHLLVGVASFRIDDPYIYGIGVHPEWRRIGIGTALKRAAMGRILETHGQVVPVASLVHKRNFAMQGLNAKLGASAERDPEQGDHYWTLALAADPKSDDDLKT